VAKKRRTWFDGQNPAKSEGLMIVSQQSVRRRRVLRCPKGSEDLPAGPGCSHLHIPVDAGEFGHDEVVLVGSGCVRDVLIHPDETSTGDADCVVQLERSQRLERGQSLRSNLRDLQSAGAIPSLVDHKVGERHACKKIQEGVH
jgi:hypothetical protein